MQLIEIASNLLAICLNFLLITFDSSLESSMKMKKRNCEFLRYLVKTLIFVFVEFGNSTLKILKGILI